jgi:hypothetical protein
MQTRLTKDRKHILRMPMIPLPPSLIRQRINHPRTMIALVKRNRNQPLRRRSTLRLPIPVIDSRLRDTGHTRLRRKTGVKKP